MKKKVHKEVEMVKAVKELESGISADIVSRNYGISRASLYNWKSKYSGMDVSQVEQLRSLQEENRRLKQMYADLALDNKILREVIEKNSRARDKKGVYNGDSSRISGQHNSGVPTNGTSPFVFLL